MLKEKKFDNDLFQSYLKKLRTENDSLKNKNIESALMSWIEWLKDKHIISAAKFNQLMRDIESNRRKDLPLNDSKIQSTNDPANRPIVIYFLIILILCSLGFNIFLFKKVENINQQFKIAEPLGRVLPFKGTIRETDGAPLDTKRDAIFSLYTSLEGGQPAYVGSCIGENGLTPSHDGSFSILVGSDCGMKPIPEDLFKNNNSLYLGIKIGNEPEFTPRHQIITSTFSRDTNKLQGLAPGTEGSSIPFINEEGEIVISQDSPVLKSTNGLFTVEGKTVTIRSTEEGGNIVFDPAVGSDIIIGSGKLGLGTFTPESNLDISGSSLIGTIASISNLSREDSSDASVLKLSVGTSPDGSNSEFIEFFAGKDVGTPGIKVGGIRLNNQSVVYETSAADFAEYFEVDNVDVFRTHQIVALAKEGIKPAVHNGKILGVISESAGYIGNNKYAYSNSILVGLVGQVEVLVTDINGTIEKGDIVGATNIQGYGGKNTDDTFKVGYALENTSNEQMRNSNCPQSVKATLNVNGAPIKCGTIRVILSLD